MNLPFIDPDRNLHLNLAVILIIVGRLSNSKRGKSVLDKNRINIYHYLLSNPTQLQLAISKSGKSPPKIDVENEYNLKALAPDIDEAYDTKETALLIQALIEKNLIRCSLSDDGSALYSMTSEGEQIEHSLTSEYFDMIRTYCCNLLDLQSTTVSKLLKEISSPQRNGSGNV